MNAKEFVLEQAELLREAGYQVKITNEDYGISVVTVPPSMFGTHIGLGAYFSNHSKRWSFLGAHFYPFHSKSYKRTTYRQVRSAISVFTNTI